jgi:ATP-binding cassette subfamily B (MDR/TAP) protein 1
MRWVLAQLVLTCYDRITHFILLFIFTCFLYRYYLQHRLQTIINADRIAFIGDGRVKEIGSHDELMEKPKGRYKRLVESQGRTASTILLDGMSPSSTNKKKTTIKKKGSKKIDDDDENKDEDNDDENNNDDDGNAEKDAIEKEELSAFNLARARKLASPDAFYLLAGSLGALMAGSVFPAWGLLFAGK